MGLLGKIKNLFKKKSEYRKGALPPEEVKKRIKEIGENKVVEIIRIGYDDEIDDMPLILQIKDIQEDYFVGKVINPEREMIEKNSENVVYAKKGGGVIEYRYDDGDIKDIVVSKDEEILQNSKNIEELKEMLQAIEINDPVLICYWDKESHGTINTKGKLVEKKIENYSFKIEIESINNIELQKKQVISFDLQKDLIIDIQYAG